MPENNKIEELVESIKKYININYDLIKLEAIKKFSVMTATLTRWLLIGVAFFFFIFFISMMAALYLSSIFGQNFIGFGIVASFYFILVIVLVKIKKKHIEDPVRDAVIKEIFSKKE